VVSITNDFHNLPVCLFVYLCDPNRSCAEIRRSISANKQLTKSQRQNEWITLNIETQRYCAFWTSIGSGRGQYSLTWPAAGLIKISNWKGPTDARRWGIVSLAHLHIPGQSIKFSSPCCKFNFPQHKVPRC